MALNSAAPAKTQSIFLKKVLVKFFTMRQTFNSQTHNWFGLLSHQCRLKQFFYGFLE
jgi:hypothetical protein